MLHHMVIVIVNPNVSQKGRYYYLCQGGYVFVGVCVCLPVCL